MEPLTISHQSPKVFIGTSGWSYPHWFGTFYPDELLKNKAFEYYQSKFTTVELNVTFYRLLPKSTFEGWHKRATDNFIFAVKGSRFITHLKRLRNHEEPLERFFDRVTALQEKAGPILWQLPSNYHKDLGVLTSFLNSLPDKYRHAFEFRHQSWFDEEVYKLLEEHKASLVIADSPRWPLVEEITADFSYIRFHGGRVLYGSNYSEEELHTWAGKINHWLGKGIDVYAYFNNDFMGFAPNNALYLKSLTR